MPAASATELAREASQARRPMHPSRPAETALRADAEGPPVLPSCGLKPVRTEPVAAVLAPQVAE